MLADLEGPMLAQIEALHTAGVRIEHDQFALGVRGAEQLRRALELALRTTTWQSRDGFAAM